MLSLLLLFGHLEGMTPLVKGNSGPILPVSGDRINIMMYVEGIGLHECGLCRRLNTRLSVTRETQCPLQP